MCYKTQLKVWGDNDATEYALVLQHCPEEFQVELKNQEEWVAIDNAMSVVRLLILIPDQEPTVQQVRPEEINHGDRQS